MYKNLLEKVRTKEDVDLLEAEVDLLMKSLYEQKENFDKILNSEVRYWVSEIIRGVLEKGEVSQEKYLKDLKDRLENFKSVRIGLAFEPSLEGMESIADWLKKNVSEDTVSDFYLQKKIIGGAVIEYEGEYRDFSVRKKLESVLNNSPKETENSRS